jgi:hypothetical protein
MTPEQRARLSRRLLLFGPLVAAIGGVVVSASGLADFAQKQVPSELGGYSNQAMGFAPLGWLVLALGCSLGTCLHLARRKGATGWRLAAWLCGVTPCIFAAQVIVCTGIAVGGCMLLVGTHE